MPRLSEGEPKSQTISLQIKVFPDIGYKAEKTQNFSGGGP